MNETVQVCCVQYITATVTCDLCWPYYCARKDLKSEELNWFPVHKRETFWFLHVGITKPQHKTGWFNELPGKASLHFTIYLTERAGK